MLILHMEKIKHKKEVLETLIQWEVRVENLVLWNFIWAPPFSKVWDAGWGRVLKETLAAAQLSLYRSQLPELFSFQLVGVIQWEIILVLACSFLNVSPVLPTLYWNKWHKQLSFPTSFWETPLQLSTIHTLITIILLPFHWQLCLLIWDALNCKDRFIYYLIFQKSTH